MVKLEIAINELQLVLKFVDNSVVTLLETLIIVSVRWTKDRQRAKMKKL